MHLQSKNLSVELATLERCTTLGYEITKWRATYVDGVDLVKEIPY